MCLLAKKKPVEHRTRHNREENRNKDFAKQINAFTNAYMEWDQYRASAAPSTAEQELCGAYLVHIVDVFGKSQIPSSPHLLTYL
jgi:hypothetical protein